ncbi:hypothetical protein Tsubulata_048292 [Turnera subulata]|uniref:Tubby-like F-box protein n=1 Tax=Turnera subulata TaxID=218843 RepID=A0A9Q0JNQ9_9ROSI|nr:hypothetical protein Tsubulata_048292 [Turnera subulata]
MSLKSIVRELREIKDGIGNISRRGVERGRSWRGRARSHIAPDETTPESDSTEQGQWANLPPELLLDIIRRVEESETSWPARAAVVYCASVCKSWREITQEIVKTPEQCGRLTFPISLKQVSRALAILLYSASLEGILQLLLIFCTMVRFTIFDSEPACEATLQPTSRANRRFHARQVSPRLPACNYSIGTITYELNVLRTRGPRRMQCVMHSIPMSSIEEGGTVPLPSSFPEMFEDQSSLSSSSKRKENVSDSSSTLSSQVCFHGSGQPLILKNKAPRWHEQLQCWCLNFRGRVTVASVKNFQLVAAVEPSQNVSAEEQEKVNLQFGKIGKDIFTMDYRYPLSAFQAFAICLSSFDTKPACE